MIIGSLRRAVASGLSFATGLVLISLAGASVQAFEVPADEKERLKSCERTLCEIILKREEGPDLSCALSKTWASDKIRAGVESRTLEWSWGDARCSLDLEIARASILSALEGDEYSFEVPAHKAICQVEHADESITEVSMSLAPKIMFEKGIATSASIGMSDLEGPKLITGALWSVAKFEEWFGLFEDDMLDEINEFIGKKCAKRYGG